MSGELRSIFPGFAPADLDPDRHLTHRQLLGRRLHLNSWVRYCVSLSLILAALVADRFLDLPALKVAPLTLLGLVIGLYNTIVFFVVRRYREPDRSARAFRHLRVIMYVAIVCDFLALAVAVHLLGGARSPFMAFYILHVVLSCVMLSRRAAVSFTALAYALVATQVIGEWFGVRPFDQSPFNGDVDRQLDAARALSILVVYGVLFALTDFLLISIVEWLRNDERELRATNEALDRLSQLRRDFLHVAIHDLKSPLGASMMLLENLQNGLAGPVNDRQAEWIGRCYSRLDSLIALLQNVEMLGALETEELPSQRERVDIPDMLRDVIDEFEDLAQSRRQSVRLSVESELPPVWGIRRLLRQAVANYVSNAVKYTPDHGTIDVSARAIRRSAFLRIEVRDDGPGIEPADLHKLFLEFSRVRTIRAGGPPRVQSTGLGLSLVKRIVELHGGHVGVESKRGEGTLFYMELPVEDAGPGTASV